MSFLQPWMLAALPLMLLPIVIHLINRQRHRSVHWAAMMFLVRAKRMNQGMARLRYLLILLLRMLAIAALVFAVSRPLATGKLSGLGAGRPDVTLVLLDRSASMETKDLQTGRSRRSTALAKLSELLAKRGHGDQLIVIDSANGETQELDGPSDLLELPNLQATATSANVPGMLQRGLDFLEANASGRADVWICSDLGENDWDAGSGRWTALRERAAGRQGVEYFLLSYAAPPPRNLSIRVDNVERRQRGQRAELVLDVQVRGKEIASAKNAGPGVPVEFQIGGLRSVVQVELSAFDDGERGAALLRHRIPIDGELRSGWGKVSLPGDANSLDNDFYFAFADTPLRGAAIVAEDPEVGEALRRALAIPSDFTTEHRVDVLTPERTAEIDWQGTALLAWQAPLPDGELGAELERFVESGRVVIFLPPTRPDDGTIYDARWGKWQDREGEQRLLSSWRGDADLLAHVGSGDPLPLSDLRVFRSCALEGPGVQEAGTALARVGKDTPLLVRANTDRGGVYFCSTLPTEPFSSFERDGVAFYVMLQRALSQGARSLSRALQRDASADALADFASSAWVKEVGDAPPASQRGLHAGVYQEREHLIALNRSFAEDRATAVPAAMVDALFEGLAYRRIDDDVADGSSLASEIWRAFLIAMLIALLLEAVLCLPEKPQRTSEWREGLAS